VSVGKKILDECSVHSGHTGMMDGKNKNNAIPVPDQMQGGVYLNVPVGKKILDKCSLHSGHDRMMDGETRTTKYRNTGTGSNGRRRYT
jgi:hypothetical protein